MLKQMLAAVILALVVGGSLMLSPLVLAQAPAGQGLQISPPVEELALDPGDRTQFKIKLTNISDVALVAKPEVNDFIAQGEEGQPKILISEEEKTATAYGMRSWFSAIPGIHIKPRETVEVTVNVKVPENATPGGHYAVVRFTATPEDIDEQGLSLSTSIGTLVLARVSGDINESLSLREFYTSYGESRTSLFQSDPIIFTERLVNNGNTHLQPQGEVVIRNVFGQEVARLAVNREAGNVLPDSTRRFSQEFSKKVLFGRYNAELSLDYGDNKTLAGTTSFWVIPYGLIGLVALGVLVLVSAARFLLFRYEKHLLNKISP